MEKRIIHLEGFVVLLAAIYIYALCGFSWLIFIILLFTPDLAMVAYTINNRIGAKIYNLFHTYIISILLILIGVFFKLDPILIVGLIWTAHIGMDRMFGYGLKYETDFKDTHIQRL
ncbi:hypothetical protein IIO_01583 [Bacillus cereus VD115]|nr:hypothetical protein IIO_01583 [Bacillus cereus VD115]